MAAHRQPIRDYEAHIRRLSYLWHLHFSVEPDLPGYPSTPLLVTKCSTFWELSAIPFEHCASAPPVGSVGVSQPPEDIPAPLCANTDTFTLDGCDYTYDGFSASIPEPSHCYKLYEVEQSDWYPPCDASSRYDLFSAIPLTDDAYNLDEGTGFCHPNETVSTVPFLPTCCNKYP
jgi:hypothetical protein